MARAIKYDQAYLSRVERGQQQPSVDFLRALARELELTDLLDAIAVIDRARGGK